MAAYPCTNVTSAALSRTLPGETELHLPGLSQTARARKRITKTGFGRRPRRGDVVVTNFSVRFQEQLLLRFEGKALNLEIAATGLSAAVDGFFSADVVTCVLEAMHEGEVAVVEIAAEPWSAVLDGVRHHLPSSYREDEKRDADFQIVLEWEVELGQICTPTGVSLSAMASPGLMPLRRTIAKRAWELQDMGITALRGLWEGSLTSREVKLLLDTSMIFFKRALGRIGEEIRRDSDVVIRFLDCVARRSHRLHVKPPDLWDKHRFGFLHRHGTFHEVLQKVFGTSAFRLTHCGVLMAKPAVDGLPNNVNQAWHRDAPEDARLANECDTYAVVVYIPLVDMTERNGVTEFLLRSHREAIDCDELERSPPKAEHLVSTAGLSAGDIVIFDLRLCHRGVLNTAPELGVGDLGVRPVVALNFGVDAWHDKEDVHNWGEKHLVEGPHGK